MSLCQNPRMQEQVPAVRYARHDDVSVAYQRWGNGDSVHVVIPGLVSNLDSYWELPEMARALRRSGRVLDLIMLDKRGSGLSDRVKLHPDFETHAADVISVLDREGVERAGLYGFSEGGLVAMVTAALYPDRVLKVCTNGMPCSGAPHEDLVALADPDDPPVRTDQEDIDLWRTVVRDWTTRESPFLEIVAPGASELPRFVDWAARWERNSASPGDLLAHLRSMAGFDLRPYLDRVQCPVFLTHATRDRLVHVANGRLVASLLPDATLWEFDGDAHAWYMTAPDWEHIQDRIDSFALGREVDRGSSTVFASVLFTDIVDSTIRASELGDAGWRQLVELHDVVSQRTVAGQDGTVVKTTGDGIVATFPTPAGALAAAKAIRDQLGGSGIPIRAGVHAGQFELREDGDIAGLAVNIAARVEGCASAGEVLVSQAMRDMLLGTDNQFTDRGEHELKGIDGTWRLYSSE